MDKSTVSLRWGRLSAEVVEPWAELTNLLARVDGTEEFYDAEDLAEELTEAGFTPEQDSWTVWAGDLLVGFGQVRVGHNPDAEGRVRCQLTGGVHPDWRGQGIGRQLVQVQEERGRELAAQRHPGTPLFFRAAGELEGSDARRLLTRLGYAVARYFNELSRPLPGEELAEVEVAGVELRSPTEEQETATLEAHTAAFADHWGSSPMSPEAWHDYWTGRPQRRTVSTLALDEGGRVLAYALASQWTPRDLYVELVGTRPDARGRGLAAACLGRTIRLAGASGDYDRIELGVDSESPTGATRLYDRFGFTLERTLAAMHKDA